MADVRVRGVCKRFGKQEVLKEISCDISDGEFLVILGPSGCGKSTLLRLIAGLEEISAGEIAIAGQVVNRMEPAERDIAMVFQNYALYPHMTVYQNMAYGLKIRGMAQSEIDRRVRAAARILELEMLLERKPRQLSGGQRQRVAMGRCIVREPKVFLFDEPLSNLDAKLRVQMRLEIRKLHEQLRITSVYVTHDQVEAMTLGDRLVVMDQGRVAQIGTPLDIYERPANRFVAGFIGSPAMNILEATLAADEAGLLLPGNTRMVLPGRVAGLGAGAPVWVGIRPEHLTLATEGGGQLALKVDQLELLGADTLIHGYLGEDGVPLTVRVAGLRHYAKHAWLAVTAPAQALHLFDPQTGVRIETHP